MGQITDTFQGSSGATLDSHASDSGNTWAMEVGTAGALQLTGSGGVSLPGQYLEIDVSNWTPAAADYDVSCSLYINTVCTNTSSLMTGIGGRAGASSFTGYFALLMGACSSSVIKLWQGGNGTPLATSAAISVAQGQTHTLKLSMRGNTITVYWDGTAVITYTASGSTIVSAIGQAGIYLNPATGYANSVYVENFAASDPPATLAAGTASVVSTTSSTATIAWTAASGGVAPIAAQLRQSAHGANSWSNVSGATSSPATVPGLSPSTSYDYQVAYTDAEPVTVYSATVTATTTAAATTYTVQACDLWDNGYDNVNAPRQSYVSRFIFTTNAASVTINGSTTLYTGYPAWSELGIRVNGVTQSPPLVFTANGSQSFTVSGLTGTSTIEIIAGLQSDEGGGTVYGSFVNSVTYADSASFAVSAPTVGNRILIYGDSIAVGADATYPETQGYIPILRYSYSFRTMAEAWGYRSLYDDANTGTLLSAFVSRIAGYTPAIVWLAIGTNDYGLNKWSAASFGTAYGSLMDSLHAALPSAVIVAQTPIVRSSEAANGSGNTLGQYRAQIAAACATRPWACFVDGTQILAVADLNADGVHPTTAGQAKYADKMALALTIIEDLVSGGAIPAAGDVRLGVANGNTTGTLAVPSPSEVLSGTATDNTTGSLTLPAASQVLTTAGSWGVGGNGSIGSATLPGASYVLTSAWGGPAAYGAGGTGSTPTATLTAGSNVTHNAAAFGAGGNSIAPSGTVASLFGLTAAILSSGTTIDTVGPGTFTHTSDYTAKSGVVSASCVVTDNYNYSQSDGGSAGTYPTTASSQTVQLATDQAAVSAQASHIDSAVTILGQAGACAVPSSNDVRLGTPVRNITGTLAVPSPSEVIAGTATDNTAGTYVEVLTPNVLSGIQFGAAGTQYTGVLSCPTIQQIAGAIPSFPTVQQVAGAILADPTQPIATTSQGWVIAARTDGTPLYYTIGTIYCQRSDVEDVFGVVNVARWADLDNDQDATKIANRINRAIVWATAEMEDRLRNGPYQVPLTGTSATVVDLCAKLAGVWLYESRGTQDFNTETGQPYHRLQYARQYVETALAEIRAGKRRLDASVPVAGCGAVSPLVVRERAPRHGYGDRLGPWGPNGRDG